MYALDLKPLKNAILEAVDSENLVFDEVMEFRRILEPAIAELAALRHSPEQLDQLKIITCDQQRRLLTGQEDGDLDARFHHCLALCAGNSLLAGTMSQLNRHYAAGRTAELRDTQWRQFSVSPHLRIIDALERRSPADSRKALEEHLESGFCAGALGIPTICCMGPEGENIHTAQEYMLPSTLLPRCKLMALSALQAARVFGSQPRPSVLPSGAHV